MNIKDLKHYSKNPRKITDEKFDLLSNSLEKYGDLGGIIVNVRTGEVIGGNQRTRFFQENKDTVEIVTSKMPKKDSQGTVGMGYIVYKGNKYNYREVDWDEKTTQEANILANKATGFFDNEILLKDFDMETLLENGFEPFELTFFEEKERPAVDVDNFNHQLDTYLDSEIKQIVIYMQAKQYTDTLDLLKNLMAETGDDNTTDVVLKALEHYAKSVL